MAMLGNRYELRSKRFRGNSSNHLSGKEFSDKFNSGDQDVDEKSEANKKNYAAIALRTYAIRHPNNSFELVEFGHLAVGKYRKDRIFHFNFTAKEKKPGAELHSFFAELIKPKNSDFCARTYLLRPSHKLPENAETAGCLYCDSTPIHHPVWSFTYHCGSEEIWESLCSKVEDIEKCIEKQLKRSPDNIPSFPHPGVVYIGGKRDSNAIHAREAIRIYNEKNSSKFEFIRSGPKNHVFLRVGFITHMNIKAKEGGPGAPVTTFFAEVLSRPDFFYVLFCKCLGHLGSSPGGDLGSILCRQFPWDPFIPPHFLSLSPELIKRTSSPCVCTVKEIKVGKRKPVDVHGCCYCEGLDIHHPSDVGYLRGRLTLSDDE